MIEGHEVLTQFLGANVDARIPATQNCNFGPIAVYMRAGIYHYDADTGKREPAVGIVNIQIAEETMRGMGLFKAFILDVEEAAKFKGYKFVRFEQVQSDYLCHMLKSNGYVPSVAFDDVLVKKF
ncbi:hypothetical protein D3C85_527930 [compost metagenome]